MPFFQNKKNFNHYLKLRKKYMGVILTSKIFTGNDGESIVSVPLGSGRRGRLIWIGRGVGCPTAHRSTHFDHLESLSNSIKSGHPIQFLKLPHNHNRISIGNTRDRCQNNAIRENYECFSHPERERFRKRRGGREVKAWKAKQLCKCKRWRYSMLQKHYEFLKMKIEKCYQTFIYERSWKNENDTR